MNAREFDTWVRIERPVAADGFRGAGSGNWQLVDEVYAGIRDVLPSRSEQPGAGMPVTTRRSRVRMRYREDVTPAMRLVAGARIMQIVAGPAEIGRRAGTELMVEETSSAGNTA